MDLRISPSVIQIGDSSSNRCCKKICVYYKKRSFCIHSNNDELFLSYVEILESRGENPNIMVDGNIYSINCFKNDLMNNKVVWTNHYNTDIFNYILTNHSLLSIFYASRYHVYSKFYRLLILISSIAMTLFFSSLIAINSNENIGNNIISTILVTVFISIFNLIMKNVLLCKCFKNKIKIVKCCCKSIGLCIYLYTFMAILLYVIIGLYLLDYSFNFNEKKMKHFYLSFFLSIFLSFLFEIPLLILYFNYFWKKEHFLQNNGLLREKMKLHVTYIDYEIWVNEQYIEISESPSFSPLDDIIIGREYRSINMRL